MLAFSLDPRDWGWKDVAVAVSPAGMTMAIAEVERVVTESEFWNENVCPRLKSFYVEAAQQQIAQNPDARAQASAAKVEYYQQGCEELLPARSSTYPSGVPSSEMPLVKPKGPREYSVVPVYRRKGFWLGAAALTAASGAAYFILR